MCSGTHPFSDWADQEISPNPRYAQLVEEMQWLARRLQIFGIHVHVGVRSAEKAIAIANALSDLHPPLPRAARRRAPTGWDATPASRPAARRCSRACPPPGSPTSSSGWDEFEKFMTTLVSARSISSIREVWWDIRPHPDFGTVELRICDGIPTLAEVAAVAAMSQCLVDWLNNLIDRGLHPARAAHVGAAGEQVAGGAPRSRRRDHHRREGHAVAPAHRGDSARRGADARGQAPRVRGRAADAPWSWPNGRATCASATSSTEAVHCATWSTA